MFERSTSSLLTAPPLSSSVKSSSLDPIFRKDEKLVEKWNTALNQMSTIADTTTPPIEK